MATLIQCPICGSLEIEHDAQSVRTTKLPSGTTYVKWNAMCPSCKSTTTIQEEWNSPSIVNPKEELR